uniref:Ribosomal protein L34Ae n=1 Tax=Davidia involucrata TaxID=16924 RepID=A0A5B7A3U0_DAVIN
MGPANQFLYQKLVLFAGTFWVSVSTYLLPLFGFIRTYLFRFKTNDRSVENNSNYSEITSEENNKKVSNHISPEPETELESKEDVIDLTASENDGFDEKERPKVCFQFKFPTFEEFSISNGGNSSSLSSGEASTMSTSKYEFMSGKASTSFIQEPEIVSFNVKELNIDTNGPSFGEKEVNSEEEAAREELPENSTNGASREEEPEKIEAMTYADSKLQLHSDKDSFEMDSDSESTSSNNLHSVMSRLMGSYSDGFLSDGDFELDSLMDNNGEKVELHGEMSDSDENHFDNLSTGHEADYSDEEDRDVMEELRKLDVQNFGTFHSEFISEKDFDKSKNEKTRDGLDNSGEPNSTALDSEDSNKLETLWEHQELIEQLKMELRKVRATGLPTILEESESPKIAEDLKPWKIDEKFQHEDPMDELHKLYKSYRERMRKFDILNYQKMYAIGFLQLKDPLQSISSQKPSVPKITSLLSQNFRLRKRKKSETDPMVKFIEELQSDLEVVYVGQICLSWEFLHWQYGKALELWESDPRGICRYNEVAGEFQQFQVLMQRFIEDEPFQGPRVQNYVKSRCVLRNLLQVPVIREDSSEGRKKARRREKGEYAITSDMLVEIMEESIRIFWRLVRADKDCTNLIVKGQKGNQVELHDPADSELLMEVRKNLQKKERKLKELSRSGNCILRKFRKCEEDSSSDHVLYFFSQVDMKLVSRVINMSRITTEQLIWCRNKLNKITFVNRKIHVEPSFLLFPC